MKKVFKNFIFGIIFGSANAIPGISGGTIAVVLDFYDRLISCITLNFKKIFASLDFLVPLAVGILCGMIGTARFMGVLLDKFPCQTYFAFIGVVFGSVPLILKKATINEKIETKGIIAFIIGSIIIVAISFANPVESTIKYTSLNVESFIVIFLSMIVGSISMIIPGVSGSLVLAIMGMYETIYIEAIGNINIYLLIPTVLGGLCGLLGGSKLMRYLLERYPQITFMAILGLLLFSNITLFNYSNILKVDILTIITSIIVMLIMAFVTYSFSKKEGEK